MKFAANLSMMFTEVPFLQRFEAAAAAGFTAVEYLFPYDFNADEIAELLQQHELHQVLFNSPAGDFAGGERGLAAIPGRGEEFLAGVDTALDYARTLECPRIHAMAGLMPDGADAAAFAEQYNSNLIEAAKRCNAAGVQLLIEPINPFNMPGYYLNNFAMAVTIIDELAKQQHTIGLQFDIYHCQRIHGDVPVWLDACASHIAHFQIAGTPERHEPDVGDLPVLEIMQAIQVAGLQHLHIGCEYNPAGVTEDGLGWISNFS